MEELEFLIKQLSELKLREVLTESGTEYLKGLIKAKELLNKPSSK